MAIHGALTVPISIVHVSGMVAIRNIVWWLVYRGASTYDFLHHQPALVLFYEWRKDVLSYVLISGLVWGWDRFRRTPPTPVAAGPAQIEIKQGSRTIFLPAVDVYWIEAAGNYVEVHDARQTHLVRGTLASFETEFPALLVRVHRSRLVNRARIRALSATDAGDFTVTFDDGRTIGGSRRYRATLDPAKPPSGPPSGPAP